MTFFLATESQNLKVMMQRYSKLAVDKINGLSYCKNVKYDESWIKGEGGCKACHKNHIEESENSHLKIWGVICNL